MQASPALHDCSSSLFEHEGQNWHEGLGVSPSALKTQQSLVKDWCWRTESCWEWNLSSFCGVTGRVDISRFETKLPFQIVCCIPFHFSQYILQRSPPDFWKRDIEIMQVFFLQNVILTIFREWSSFTRLKKFSSFLVVCRAVHLAAVPKF